MNELENDAQNATTNEMKQSGHGNNQIGMFNVEGDFIINNSDKPSPTLDVKKSVDGDVVCFRNDYPQFAKVIYESGVLSWIAELFISVGSEVPERLQHLPFRIILLTAFLRSQFVEGKACGVELDMSEYTACFQSELIQSHSEIDAWSLLHLISQGTLELLSYKANDLFYRSNEMMRAMISFTTITAFFVDLYLILARYSDGYKDMIKYKTNAYLDLTDFRKHLPSHLIKIHPDIDKRRIDVEMVCDSAIVHKAAALFVNEFERALSDFEDIFSNVGFQFYYVRAKIHALASDNVTNHNFEAYTPTLIPLLAGGHLYPTNLVFIRELVQNSLDSIAVRKLVDQTEFSDTIDITMELCDDGDNVKSLTVGDNGLGMGRVEIERYLTSIGRSFYTSGDFKKMKTSYKPISSFGIGFLSCFLVSKCISIRTHKKDNIDESYELYIPNIEGCFFVEKTPVQIDIGTNIAIEIDNNITEKHVSLSSLIEYLDNHLLDIHFDVMLSWNKTSYSLNTLESNDGTQFDVFNSDIVALARNNLQQPTCKYCFIDQGVLVAQNMSRNFCRNWWNRQIKSKLDEIVLIEGTTIITAHKIVRHKIRKVGHKFFAFIPFLEGGRVQIISFRSIERTYEYPYGIFITDVPQAGMKIRNENGGILPCSGRMVFLNAGILIDSAELMSLFGQDMRLFSQDTETAYNNIIINLPPDWVELNIARDRIIGLSNSIDKKTVLRGIAEATINIFKNIITKSNGLSLVNIQEVATFVELICAELNNDKTDRDKQLLIELKKMKFWMKIEINEVCVSYCLKGDDGDKWEPKKYLANTESIRINCISHKHRTAFINKYPDYFRDFEIQLSKKRVESIDEMNNILIAKFDIPKSIAQNSVCNITTMLFTIYFLLFPNERIQTKFAKLSHCRLALEWQLIKKYSTAEFVENKCKESVSYGDVEKFITALCENT